MRLRLLTYPCSGRRLADQFRPPRATNYDKTVKRFVLDALQEKSVKIAALDLTDDGDA